MGERTAMIQSKILITNPLGAGLAHYTKSLNHVLQACGVLTCRIDVVEPSSADYGKVRWLFGYLSRARRLVAQETPDAIISTWPTVGYWDLPVLTLIAGRRPVYLVMHDPQPLVYARGYGRPARTLARRSKSGAILAHSPDAVQTISDDVGMPRVFEVLHPMLVPRRAPHLSTIQRNIRVLGQYKVDRDIGGLKRLAARASSDWHLEIFGRGWPSVDGWDVRNEFVSETYFDELVRTSHAIIIPYSRFFQSGVAVRALEWGVPVVGPYTSSLQIALGKDCRWLVRDGDWSAAVLAAVQEDRDQVSARAQALYDRVISSWSTMLQQLGMQGCS